MCNLQIRLHHRPACLGKNPSVYKMFGDISSLGSTVVLKCPKETTSAHLTFYRVRNRIKMNEKRVLPQRLGTHQEVRDGSSWGRNGKIEGILGEAVSKTSLSVIKAISFYSQEAQQVLDRMIAKKPECRHIITSFCYNGRNSCAEEKGRNRAHRTINQVVMILSEMKSEAPFLGIMSDAP